MSKWISFLVVCCLAGCSGTRAGKEPDSAPRDNAPATNEQVDNTPADNEHVNDPEPREQETPVKELRKDIATLEAKAELPVDDIEVQHLLIAHKDAGIPGVTRSKEEAEALTADLWKQIKSGADFDKLISKHTNDSAPGIYGMTMKGRGDRNKMIFPRSGMVAAFGDVGWRLNVGEFGVAPYEASKSPYGWHIIKRLK
jgi:parvulin-like peptidyl-prolyl isomerase